MEPQWGGEKSLKAAEKDHTLTDRVCAFKTSWAECRDQKRCRHRANGGDFSLDIHSYRTILAAYACPALLGSPSGPGRTHRTTNCFTFGLGIPILKIRPCGTTRCNTSLRQDSIGTSCAENGRGFTNPMQMCNLKNGPK